MPVNTLAQLKLSVGALSLSKTYSSCVSCWKTNKPLYTLAAENARRAAWFVTATRESPGSLLVILKPLGRVIAIFYIVMLIRM